MSAKTKRSLIGGLLQEVGLKRLELWGFRLIALLCVASAVGVKVHDVLRVLGVAP